MIDVYAGFFIGLIEKTGNINIKILYKIRDS